MVVLLNRKHQPIGVSTIYQGTVCGMSVRIAELFREAVRTNAAAILIAHNHPSGDPAPSTADLRITKEAVAAGQLLGIEVLDHIVIGDERWASLT
jgi:DNA repair protein RadC